MSPQARPGEDHRGLEPVSNSGTPESRVEESLGRLHGYEKFGNIDSEVWSDVFQFVL